LCEALSLRGRISIVAVICVGANRRVMERMGRICRWVRRRLLYDPDVDNHVVAEVLIASDKSVTVLIFEADSL
jgi:hypothetical protein